MTAAAPTPAPPEQRHAKFTSLAWTAVILGIVGLVGSPVLIFNNITAIAAAVGVILGVIALFGTRKVLAAVGVVLCVAAVAITVSVQQSAIDELDRAFGGAPPSAAEDGKVLKFGQTQKGQRISVKVEKPKRITTSDSAAPKQGAKALRLRVTVKNLSQQPVNAHEFTFTASADGTEADEVFDSAAGIDGPPNTDIMAGKSARFPIAFLATDRDLLVQVRHVSGTTFYYTRTGRTD